HRDPDLLGRRGLAHTRSHRIGDRGRGGGRCHQRPRHLRLHPAAGPGVRCAPRRTAAGAGPGRRPDRLHAHRGPAIGRADDGGDRRPTPTRRNHPGTIRGRPPMKRIFEVFLGILTAFGGFVDMGDLVANAQTGARFGMGLAWVVVVGVIGMGVYAEMAGRVAAISGRPVFDVIRERLGARAALVNLVASFFINLLTLTAEIAGLAVIIELVTGVNYLLWVPLAAVAVWLVIWKVKFSVIEKAFGLTGLL